MIHLPRRSVTRFFIPLIDVLILLFCIYLLMPIVTPTDDGGTGTGSGEPANPLTEQERKELAELRRKLRDRDQSPSLTDKERRELEQIRKEKIDELQRRLAIRVLEIDADTGKLFFYEPERVEITSEGAARAFIQRQKQTADGRELYFLFLYPRKIKNVPTLGQMELYDLWFEGVPHGRDVPARQ